MHSPVEPPTLANQVDSRGGDRHVLLDEVHFKWLLAGAGVWTDMVRFHFETSYANHFLELAEVSDSQALRNSAAALRLQEAQSSH